MNSVFELKNKYSYAMHGNGAYRGLRQTNTKDALLFWKKRGVNIFEVDLAWAEDNDYVAVAHYLNKKDLRRIEIFDLPSKKTTDWFMSQRLFSFSCKNGLQPLSLKSIISYMEEDEDALFVLDLFGMFSYDETKLFIEKLIEYINTNTILFKRILIECYNMDMVRGIRAVSDDANIIFCVRYEENEDDEKKISSTELRNNNITFISYPWYIALKHPGEIQDYADNGITVFSRTKDNRLDKKLKSCGVSVCILANKYDGIKAVYQFPLYMLTYIKRIYVKLYIKIFKSEV